jgi:hypothetical protein
MLTLNRRNSRRTHFAVLAMFLALGTTACDDDPVEVEEEPDVATMRILVGTQTIDVNRATGTVTGGPILLTVGTTTFTVQFLRADGSADPTVTAADFEVRIVSSNAARVTVATTSAFAGVLTRVAAGTASLDFQLYHTGVMHGEFNWPVPVTVQ